MNARERILAAEWEYADPHDHYSRQPRAYPKERELWLAVLRRGCEDALGNIPSNDLPRTTNATSVDNHRAMLQAEARRWLRDPSDEPGSCRWIMRVTGVTVPEGFGA